MNNIIKNISRKLGNNMLTIIVEYIITHPKIIKGKNLAQICRCISNKLKISWSLKYELPDNDYEQVFTLTFGDRGENHKGNQMIGNKADVGFDYEDLKGAQKWFDERMISNEIICLNDLLSEEDLEIIEQEVEQAYILVARNGLSAICDPDEFYDEQDGLEKDRKVFAYGKVVNKHARANLCFSKKSQKPNYEEKMGTIVAWRSVPLLNQFRETLPEIIGEKGEDLIAEGNYYEDLKKCGIGWHGDAERVKVIAVRVGANMNLFYQWFFQGKPIGSKFEIILGHGDVYFMSQKAVGTDWKRKIIPTLRHSAGADKYTNLNKWN